MDVKGTSEPFFINHPNATSSFLSVLGEGMSSSTGTKWRMVLGRNTGGTEDVSEKFRTVPDIHHNK
jgi:hypothetical protein